MEPFSNSSSPFIGPLNEPIPLKKKGEGDAITRVAKEKIRSRVAEDTPRSSVKLKRQASLPDLGKIKESSQFEADVSLKTSALWNCIERKPDKYGGYIYAFKLKEEYDDVTSNDKEKKEALQKIYKEIYPALELQGSAVVEVLPDVDDKQIWKKLHPDASSEKEAKENYKNSFTAKLKALGYCSRVTPEGVYMFLPDKEALTVRWEKLREKDPTLPKLDIISSEGISDDMAFVEAFFTHDALLSTGKEFVHDHHGHIFPLIGIILNPQNELLPYNQSKAALVKVVAEGYRGIMLAKREIEEGVIGIPKAQLALLEKRLEILEAGLGAFVDGLSSLPRYDKSLLDKHFENIFNPGEEYSQYFDTRFGAENVERDELTVLWDQIKEITAQFDALRKQNKDKL